MEERLTYNISSKGTRLSSVFPVLKRDERVKKIKNHLAHFNNVQRNSDMGFLQITPHLTQVFYFNSYVSCVYII